MDQGALGGGTAVRQHYEATRLEALQLGPEKPLSTPSTCVCLCPQPARLGAEHGVTYGWEFSILAVRRNKQVGKQSCFILFRFRTLPWFMCLLERQRGDM